MNFLIPRVVGSFFICLGLSVGRGCWVGIVIAEDVVACGSMRGVH